jgi:hypothetical protein
MRIIRCKLQKPLGESNEIESELNDDYRYPDPVSPLRFLNIVNSTPFELPSFTHSLVQKFSLEFLWPRITQPEVYLAVWKS